MIAVCHSRLRDNERSPIQWIPKWYRTRPACGAGVRQWQRARNSKPPPLSLETPYCSISSKNRRKTRKEAKGCDAPLPERWF